MFSHIWIKFSDDFIILSFKLSLNVLIFIFIKFVRQQLHLEKNLFWKAEDNFSFLSWRTIELSKVEKAKLKTKISIFYGREDICSYNKLIDLLNIILNKKIWIQHFQN